MIWGFLIWFVLVSVFIFGMYFEGKTPRHHSNVVFTVWVITMLLLYILLVKYLR